MILTDTRVAGAFLIEPERVEDERGFFARTWCWQECAAHGLNPRVVQCSLAFNKRLGTLRGLHYQAAPYEEAKVVHCISGAVYDVIVDLRPGSPTYLQHAAILLSAENRLRLYVPEGVAHGYQTLQDGSEVLYQMSQVYSAPHARGVRWNDPAFGIAWPPGERIISSRDRSYPDFIAAAPS